MYVINPDTTVQLISCTIGCIGFVLWFNIKGKQILFSGIGAFFTWVVYLEIYAENENNFMATLVASIFVAAYAFVMSRVCKAPSTIFLTAVVMPLIPGAKLYYAMASMISGDYDLAKVQGLALLETCLAIAFGFIVVDCISRYIMLWKKWERH